MKRPRAKTRVYPTPRSQVKSVRDTYTCTMRVGSHVFVGRGETEAQARKAATESRNA